MLRHPGNYQWFPVTSAGLPQTADPAPPLGRAHDQWSGYSGNLHQEAYSHGANSIRQLPHPFVSEHSRPTTHQQLPGTFDVAAMTEPIIPSMLLQSATAAEVSQIAATTTSRRRQARPKSENKNASKWEQHKSIMVDLYMKQNMSLEKLRRYMRDNLGFDASPKQYKTQFATWGWSKYFTHELARYMNDKHNRRLLQGKTSSQFVWRNQIWTVDAAQKLLTTDELKKSQNEALSMPTPKTPFGVSVETPLPISSPAANGPLEPEPEPEPPGSAASRVLVEDVQVLDPIRLRYKGYTFQDIAKLYQEARELEKNDDLDDAKDRYCKLLDVSKNLLSVGSEMYKDLVYKVAWFFARNEDMEQADQVLDSLSEESARRWGPVHEQTMRHYAKVGELLAQWNRHSDAVGIIARMADNKELHARTSDPLHTHVHVNNRALQESIRGIAHEGVEARTPSTLAKLREELRCNCASNGDNNEFSAKSYLELLNILEQNPSENATDILRVHCLLVTFYEKSEMQEKINETLSLAKDRTLEFCKQSLKLTTAFFQSAIDLTRALLRAKQLTAAEDLLDRLQGKFMDDYGNDHPDTISLLIEAGKMFQQLKRWDLARPRFEAAYAGVMSRFGVDSLLAKRLETSLEDRHYSFKAN
ncbi:hypothetical protein GQ44DRAFT_828516 [Phaeosphaeriaceae sp. PMI808]|nr:hypothetical protein GQ44DRAFT_828516 [Phaeosphaeriaceae sp. PMI808]